MAEVNLSGVFDAEVWTQEWLKTIEKKPHIPKDEGTMLGWFANAIMAGYDHARWEREEEKKPKTWRFGLPNWCAITLFFERWKEEYKRKRRTLIAIDNDNFGLYSADISEK